MDPIALLQERMRGRSMRDLAREIPCSPAYLSDIFNGNRPIGPKILRYLGLEKVQTYVYRKPTRRRKVTVKTVTEDDPGSLPCR